MSAKDNMATQERLANAVNNGQLDDLDQVFAQSVVDHDPAPDQGPGPESNNALQRIWRFVPLYTHRFLLTVAGACGTLVLAIEE